MRVRLIIPVWNALEYVKLTLETLRDNTGYKDYELIVVDNASDEPTRKFLERTTIPDEVIFLKNNVGFPRACNLAIKRAKSDTEFIGLINSDLIFTPNWLTKLVNLMDTEEKIGILSPVRVGTREGTENEFWVLDHQFKHEGLKVPPYNFNTPDLKELIRRVMDYNSVLEREFPRRFSTFHHMIPFFCTLIRRKLFDTIGLLDEDFGMGLVEDTLYCHIASKYGWQLATRLDTFVYHWMSKSFMNFYGSKKVMEKVIKENYKVFEAKRNTLVRSVI